MSGAYLSAGGPGLLIQIHAIVDSIKYQQIKNQNLTASARNLIIGRVNYIKNQHKNVLGSTK